MSTPPHPELPKLLADFRQWQTRNPENSHNDYLTGKTLDPDLLEQFLAQVESKDHDRIQENRPADPESLVTQSFFIEKGSDGRQRIGAYRLLEQIGSGGMGTVWLAEQTEPVQRRVALKLIKSEFVSREEIARFESERQALALMEHQNIAKVLDAGTTNHGTPYFVMEHVKGVPVTEYCDRNNLSVRDRLQLFIPICQAVQHAHQKGIIHRDLKPTNILVTESEGRPVPKVIDFGLAKALDHTRKLTDKTLYTEVGKVVGTLQYMSPEQAALNSNDIDTRTDIYSLGIVLYELLTGSTPLSRETIKQETMLRVLELIREGEPPRPSNRLSSLGTAQTGVSEHRQIEPRKLQSILRGELDWVVMKALEKDRRRRYETAAAFADDVQRFMVNEPVVARPPSNAYKFSKFVSRNRLSVAAAISIAALALIGFIGLYSAYRNSVLAEKLSRENAQQADRFSNELAESQETALEAIAQLTRSLGAELKGFLADDIQLKTDQIKPNPLVRSRNSLAVLYGMLGFHFRAQSAAAKDWGPWFEKSAKVFEELESEETIEAEKLFSYSTVTENVAYYVREQGDRKRAIQYGRKSLETLEKLESLASDESKSKIIEAEASALLNLGLVQNAIENNTRSINLLLALNNLSRDGESTLASAYYNRAIERTKESPRDAELDLLSSIELWEKLGHRESLMKVSDYMAAVQKILGSPEKARLYSDKSTQLAQENKNTLGAVTSFYNSGLQALEVDDIEKALSCFEQAVPVVKKLAEQNPNIRFDSVYYQLFWNRAEAYLELGRIDDAANDLAEAASAVIASRNPEFLVNLPYLQTVLLECQAQSDPIKAAKSLDPTTSHARGKSEILIKLAAIYSLAAAAEASNTARQNWVDKGIGLLESAKSQGLLPAAYVEEIKTGADFAALRADSRFGSLLRD